MTEAHPSDTLRLVIMRYLAFHGCSTSGVEQNFSKLQNQITPARDHMDPATYLAEAKVVIDCSENDLKEVCKVAQDCWRKVHGPRETLAATDWMQGFQGKGNLKVRRSGSESAVSMWVGENAALVSRDTVTQTDLQPIFS